MIYCKGKSKAGKLITVLIKNEHITNATDNTSILYLYLNKGCLYIFRIKALTTAASRILNNM